MIPKPFPARGVALSISNLDTFIQLYSLNQVERGGEEDGSTQNC